MKKYIIILIVFVFAHTLNAQVLFTEDFNSYTTGKISNDRTGTVPGKGGWYVDDKKMQLPKPNEKLHEVMVTPELNRSNTMAITSSTVGSVGSSRIATSIHTFRNDIHTLWNNRASVNNILKIEYDFLLSSGVGGTLFPKEMNTSTTILLQDIFSLHVYSGNEDVLSRLIFTYKTDSISNESNKRIEYYKTIYFPTAGGGKYFYENFPFNSWITAQFYLEYNYDTQTNKPTGGKIHVFIPALKILRSVDFICDTEPKMLEIRAGNNLFSVDKHLLPEYVVKYDNIQLTALNTMPTLGVNKVLASQFTMYPNPASTIVTITNNQSMLVKQVKVYDVSGKLLSTQNFNEQVEIQLNIESLASGTYLLHIQTAEGTAVKKLVKK